jgi:hypothetical protein
LITTRLGAKKTTMRLLLQGNDGPVLEGQQQSSVAAPANGLNAYASRWVVHPFLIAIYPILALGAQNAGQVLLRDLVGLIAVVVLAVLASLLVLHFALRDVRKAGLITSLAVVLFATFATVHEACELIATRLGPYWVKGEYRVYPMALVLFEVLLLAGLARMFLVKIKDARAATSFLNVFALFLVIFPFSILVLVKAPTAARPPRQAVAFELPPRSDRPQLPDIYYIILDGYARSDVMKELFQFDNEPFLQRLERKGFYVARRSTSNYCQTPLSLSSSLNAVYLDDLVKALGVDQTELTDLIGTNNVVATLRPLGYKFVTFATGFDPTEHPEADVYSTPRPYFSGFQRMVVDSTPLRQIWPGPNDLKSSMLSRERTQYLLDHLPEIAHDPAPTFTFAHLVAPHPPFVFGKNGETVGVRYLNFEIANRNKARGRFADPERFIEGYRDQSIFITRRIEETIDRILATSPEPPIIILQSDHGSELNLDPEDVQNTDLKERMSILNAYYFPGKRYEGIYDSISPVNSFRVLLNTFYGANIKLLPDRSYFSTWSEPYKFVDVTDAVWSSGSCKH